MTTRAQRRRAMRWHNPDEPSMCDHWWLGYGPHARYTVGYDGNHLWHCHWCGLYTNDPAVVAAS